MPEKSHTHNDSQQQQYIRTNTTNHTRHTFKNQYARQHVNKNTDKKTNRHKKIQTQTYTHKSTNIK